MTLKSKYQVYSKIIILGEILLYSDGAKNGAYVNVKGLSKGVHGVLVHEHGDLSLHSIFEID